jgi:hypothetical protein
MDPVPVMLCSFLNMKRWLKSRKLVNIRLHSLDQIIKGKRLATARNIGFDMPTVIHFIDYLPNYNVQKALRFTQVPCLILIITFKI